MNVLFVCTGNTCRSPMAEAVLRQMAQERGCESLSVRSAGLSALPGEPAADAARFAVRHYGATLENHASRPVTADDVAWADLILTMTHSHLERLRAAFPESTNVGPQTLLQLLGSNRDIADPFGAGPTVYASCLATMLPALEALCEQRTVKFRMKSE